MNEQIYISFCIGCNKDGKYFRPTLQSIIELINKNDLFDYSQICICNDSNEICGDFKVAQQYKNKYPELFVLFDNEKNMGISYTYQRLLYQSKGQFFLAFDSDDIIADFDILKSLRFLKQHDQYVGSYGIKRLFDNNGSNLGDTGMYCDLYDFGFFCNHNSMILKRLQAIQAGGYYPDFFKHKSIVASDMLMWIGMFLYKQLYFQRTLRCYGRCHDNNHSEKNHQLYVQQLTDIQLDLLEAYKEKGARLKVNLTIIAQGILKHSYNQDKIKNLFLQQFPRQVLFSPYMFPYYIQFLSKNNYVAEVVSALIYGALYNNEQLNDYIAYFCQKLNFISKSLHNFNKLIKNSQGIPTIIQLNKDKWFNSFFV